MAYEVKLHPTVAKFLDTFSSNERKRLVESLENLKQNPFKPRSGTDIKKLKGKLHDLYRLRDGDYRFEYFVEDNTVWIVKSFIREHGYSH